MKCFVLLLVCLSSLISNVCSLGLTIQLDSLGGMKASVVWTRQPSDPDPLGFDLRFVNPPYTDVGLARANIYPNIGEISGNLSIEFPRSGKYMLVAVSGEDHVQIGRSAEIEIEIPISTSTPTRPNAFIPPTNVIQTTVTVPATCKKHHVNVPAIIGGVIGGVSLVGLLAAALLFIRRRRATPNSRISFHGDMMVQPNESDGPDPPIGKPRRQGGFPVRYAFRNGGSSTSSRPPILANRSVFDVEQGLPIPSPMTPVPGTPSVRTPLGMRPIVPPPLGPRDRTHKSCSAKQTPPKTPSLNDDQPTPRQQQLTDKLAQVEKQIEQMKSQSKPGPSEVVLLDDLELQKAWLEKQLCCMWALGETDTLPPGFSRYMLGSLEEDDNVG